MNVDKIMRNLKKKWQMLSGLMIVEMSLVMTLLLSPEIGIVEPLATVIILLLGLLLLIRSGEVKINKRRG